MRLPIEFFTASVFGYVSMHRFEYRAVRSRERIYPRMTTAVFERESTEQSGVTDDQKSVTRKVKNW
jgi:hypothetical protein